MHDANSPALFLALLSLALHVTPLTDTARPSSPALEILMGRHLVTDTIAAAGVKLEITFIDSQFSNPHLCANRLNGGSLPTLQHNRGQEQGSTHRSVPHDVRPCQRRRASAMTADSSPTYIAEHINYINYINRRLSPGGQCLSCCGGHVHV